VRTYDNFKSYILKNGIPDIISFDHDLADEHYNSYFKDNDNINYEKFKEKTGYECAKWLIDYMLNEKIINIPKYYIHSLNPIGGNNINGLLKSFEKFLNK